MTPGTYIRQRREADELTCDGLALALDSVPPICHRERTEVLEAIEAGLVPVSLSTAVALSKLLSIDTELLADLIEANGERAPGPILRRAARAPIGIAIAEAAA